MVMQNIYLHIVVQCFATCSTDYFPPIGKVTCITCGRHFPLQIAQFLTAKYLIHSTSRLCSQLVIQLQLQLNRKQVGVGYMTTYCPCFHLNSFQTNTLQIKIRCTTSSLYFQQAYKSLATPKDSTHVICFHNYT